MEIISDTIDASGKRHTVVRYTDEEKAAMAKAAEEHKAAMEAERKAKEDEK